MVVHSLPKAKSKKLCNSNSAVRRVLPTVQTICNYPLDISSKNANDARDISTSWQLDDRGWTAANGQLTKTFLTTTVLPITPSLPFTTEYDICSVFPLIHFPLILHWSIHQTQWANVCIDQELALTFFPFTFPLLLSSTKFIYSWLCSHGDLYR